MNGWMNIGYFASYFCTSLSDLKSAHLSTPQANQYVIFLPNYAVNTQSTWNEGGCGEEDY